MRIRGRTRQNAVANTRDPRNAPVIMYFNAMLTWTGAVLGTVGIWLTAGKVFPAVAHWQEHVARTIQLFLRP